ncbi:MAG: TetR/AcrR family transcriptional regulator [bacterium]
MKRKDEILVVSLRLFNEEGEAGLSAVDIANEMDISPGNLYYHYRGKEEIIAALYEQYEASIQTLLHDSLENIGQIEDFVARFCVVLEQVYRYRFLYRNSNDLLDKYSGIERRFKRLMRLMQTFVATNLQQMIEAGLLDTDMVILGKIDVIADNVVMILTYFNEYSSLCEEPLGQDEFVHACFEKVIGAISPFAGQNMARYINLTLGLLDQLIEQD